MESTQNMRLAHIGIIVSDLTSAGQVNALLSSAGNYIVGRMGLPYKPRGVSIISVVLDAPADVINALGGRLNALPGVTAKALFQREGLLISRAYL